MSEETPIKVSIEQIKIWLGTGVTRCEGDPNYNIGLGSIQEKYGLNKTNVGILFQDSRLKGLRVAPIKAPAFVITEDEVELPSSRTHISGTDPFTHTDGDSTDISAVGTTSISMGSAVRADTVIYPNAEGRDVIVNSITGAYEAGLDGVTSNETDIPLVSEDTTTEEVTSDDTLTSTGPTF